ncbi:MAG: GDSL-type esterase/lipase family protein [Verrucomicrobiales bacterium]|nr:GDSL-type esterase/lipase family protein [Verrucomicrobiales bacterium]
MRNLVMVVLMVGCGVVLGVAEEGKWEQDLVAFEKKDVENPPEKGGVLFLGSSSVRKWKLDGSFPGLGALNRGFGGSQIADSVEHFDRLVVPYAPRLIVFYAGDNDVGKGKTPEVVLEDYVAFVGKVRAVLADTEVVFIAIKPSRKRWELWPTMAVANGMIRGYSRSDERLHYADIAAPMLAGVEAGPPAERLFEEDGLHLSAEGYALWSEVVGAFLGLEEKGG